MNKGDQPNNTQDTAKPDSPQTVPAPATEPGDNQQLNNQPVDTNEVVVANPFPISSQDAATDAKATDDSKDTTKTPKLDKKGKPIKSLGKRVLTWGGITIVAIVVVLVLVYTGSIVRHKLFPTQREQIVNNVDKSLKRLEKTMSEPASVKKVKNLTKAQNANGEAGELPKDLSADDLLQSLKDVSKGIDDSLADFKKSANSDAIKKDLKVKKAYNNFIAKLEKVNTDIKDSTTLVEDIMPMFRILYQQQSELSSGKVEIGKLAEVIAKLGEAAKQCKSSDPEVQQAINDIAETAPKEAELIKQGVLEDGELTSEQIETGKKFATAYQTISNKLAAVDPTHSMSELQDAYDEFSSAVKSIKE